MLRRLSSVVALGDRRARRRLGDESGSMLIELLIALSFLAITIGALVTVYASTILSLRHTSIEGNALTLVDKQMEMFKTLPYSGIAITGVPGSGDPYVADPPSNLDSGQRAAISGGQATGGTISATQTVTGPDNRTYRVDTYVFPITPNLGQPGLQITVAVRLVTGGTTGTIRAQAVTAIDLASTQVPT
jgi:type II secretory pathway pseudopilin PulG